MTSSLFGQSMQQVTSFGSNPGDLNMYKYVPNNMPSNAPLVMVLHGCGQTAAGYATSTEWNALADKYKFYVAYAEQKSSNNSSYCFNWFNSTDQSRGQGEALSIKQMVDNMKSAHSVEDTMVFVTGLSAGGAMSAVMMSTYPDVFSGGAIMAGLPYKSATNSTEAFSAMNGNVDKSPSQWETLVKDAYPGYSGEYPTLSVFHGTNDGTVDPVNARELMEQWTAVHNTDQTRDEEAGSFAGSTYTNRKIYTDPSGKEVVVRYTISGMGHGISVDPGSPICKARGGNTGTNSFDMDLYSSYWAIRSFDIIPDVDIEGPTSANLQQTGLNFSTEPAAGSTFNWSVPSGATITNGQGSASISVDWGSSSGFVKVFRTDGSGCSGLPDSSYVSITSLAPSKGNIPEVVRIDGENPFGAEGLKLKVLSGAGSSVNIRVLDRLGREVKEYGPFMPGEVHRIGRSLTRGYYLIQLEGPEGEKGIFPVIRR